MIKWDYVKIVGNNCCAASLRRMDVLVTKDFCKHNKNPLMINDRAIRNMEEYLDELENGLIT